MLHYFRQEHDIMNGTTENVRALNGRRLQEYLSSLILDNCENIAISPTIWDAFGAKKHQAIRERFIPELSALSYGPPERLAELEYRRLARDSAGRRVIFTGVGVFMGPPANLPSFMRMVK